MTGHSLAAATGVEGESVSRTLVVEDSAVYRKLISDNLATWGFEAVLAKSGNEAWDVLQQSDSPRLVLLDWVLPDLDGTELCRRIRAADTPDRYVYVILLTSKEGRQNMLDAMQAGADDYLAKPFDEMELKARLMVGKRILGLHADLVTAREKMRHAATHDSLTGLMNRGEILAMLERELDRARREKRPVSIILGDVDHFKSVNDTYGHVFGDEALREIGRCLRSQIRLYDGVGRYGGEEFLMVLPNCDLENALERANAIREAVGASTIAHDGREESITMSMGIAVSQSIGKTEIETLLNQADAGLYAAKENGRDRIEYFTAESTSTPARRHAPQHRKK